MSIRSRHPFPARLLGATLGLCALLLLAAPGAGAVPPGCSANSSSATKCSPAWRLESVSQPTNFPPGDESGRDQYVITAENDGGASTNGSPITVTEELPAGLRLAEGEVQTRDDLGNTVTCTTGPPLVCTDEDLTPLGPGQGLTIVVPVDVAAGAPATVTNRDAISGGGAAPAASTESTTISAATPAFGEQSFQNEVLNYDGTPDTQAGSHPFQMTTRIHLTTVLSREGKVTPTGSLKNTRLELPAGLVGTATAAAQCPGPRLTSVTNPCPADSQVGTAIIMSSGLNARGSSEEFAVYNMVPPPNMPAQFAIPIVVDPVYIDTAVRTGRDYGVTATVVDAAQLAPLTGISVTLWGTPADPSHEARRCEHPGGGCPPTPAGSQALPLLTQATACGGPQTTANAINSWQEPNIFAGASYTSQNGAGEPAEVGGCERLSFEPSMSVQPTTSVAESPTGLAVALNVPQPGLTSPTGLSSSALRTATVALPPGTTVSPSAAEGLGACSQAQIGLKEATPPSCPDSSKIGTVEISSPLVPAPLTGTVYLAQPNENPFGSLLALYLSAEGDGVQVKLAGHVVADPGTGQLTATFAENPQLPFTDFKLDFIGGTRAPLMTPVGCGTYTTTGSLSPWSGSAPAAVSSTFAVTSGCAGGFGPSFAAGTVNPQAGSYSPFVLRLERGDGSQRFASIETSLPPGLLGKLAGIPYCSDAELAAAAGIAGRAELASSTCPAASEVGVADVGAGPGPDPYHVTGRAYLAGPYKGAPLSLAVLTPAVAGPFDLGTVVTRVALQVDPETAQVHAVSDSLPTILQGIPLDVRSITLDLNRPDFTLNPTSCAPSAVTGGATSTAGTVAPLSSRFQAAGCAGLGFGPKLKLSLHGSTRRAGHPALRAALTFPKGGGDANIAHAQVGLPSSEFLDQGNLNKVCTQAQLKTSTCPKSSIYGHAKAWTPLLAKPLEGPVYLGVGFGYKLPALVADLNGQIRILLVGKVDTTKQGGIRNTFEAVPDAPVSRFVLDLKGGKNYGLLENSEDLCRKAQRASVRFVGQNGKAEQLQPRIANDCGAGPKRKGGR